VVAVSQGADLAAREELMRPQSCLVGAVAFFPENYGNIIIDMASSILQGKQTPPAVYTNHLLVLSEKSMKNFDLGQLNYEAISVKNYDEASRQIIQSWQSLLL
jgi:hypothetical protein